MMAQDIRRAQSLKPTTGNPLFAAVRSAVERCFQAITGSSQVQVTYNFDTDEKVPTPNRSSPKARGVVPTTKTS